MKVVTAFGCKKSGAHIRLFFSLSVLSKIVEYENGIIKNGIILVLNSVFKECYT